MSKYLVKGIRVEEYYTVVDAENETEASMILEEQSNIEWKAVVNSRKMQITGDIRKV